MYGCKTIYRSSIDGLYKLRESNLKNRRSLWENYAGIIPDFNIFCSILDQLTDDYTALYIKNDARSNNWTECIFWYKAKIPPRDFKFGSQDYRSFHDTRYNHE